MNVPAPRATKLRYTSVQRKGQPGAPGAVVEAARYTQGLHFHSARHGFL